MREGNGRRAGAGPAGRPVLQGRHAVKVNRFLRRDSRDPRTAAAVQDALGGRPADFLFVDADHSYEGVTANFRLYGPLVRAGGLIAFHDILPNLRDPTIQVHRLWQNLRRRVDVTEWVDPDAEGHAPGIGLLRVPPGGVATLLP